MGNDLLVSTQQTNASLIKLLNTKKDHNIWYLKLKTKSYKNTQNK